MSTDIRIRKKVVIVGDGACGKVQYSNMRLFECRHCKITRNFLRQRFTKAALTFLFRNIHQQRVLFKTVLMNLYITNITKIWGHLTHCYIYIHLDWKKCAFILFFKYLPILQLQYASWFCPRYPPVRCAHPAFKLINTQKEGAERPSVHHSFAAPRKLDVNIMILYRNKQWQNVTSYLQLIKLFVCK